MIDREKLANGEIPDWSEKIRRSWDEGGHEVALTDYEGTNFIGKFTGGRLICECDLNYEILNGNKHYACEPDKCKAKEVVRKKVNQEVRAKYKKRWDKIGLEATVFDIYKRHKRGEYLGQHHYGGKGDGLLYIQDVAAILDLGVQEIRGACEELFKRDKLDCYGAILIDYKKRFRFPKEIQQLFAYMVEEPLECSNGGASGFSLGEIERVIHRHTNLKHGRQAFGENNYPHIDPHTLLLFGEIWIWLAAERSSNPKEISEMLIKLATKIEAIKK